ncbi:MAG TPA: helix-turn-helix transcriptional regulator [Micromonosporaceae bacterium]|nr:helix-turn-helix transcriptional regulator [Micromonosporaceae bacterium]
MSETFGQWLARLRRQRGWSQRQLAERLSVAALCPTVTRNEVSRWECGGRTPDAFWCAWLADTLNVSYGELLAARSGRVPTAPAHRDPV